MGIGPLQEQLPAPQIAFSRVDRMEQTVRGRGDESIETIGLCLHALITSVLMPIGTGPLPMAGGLGLPLPYQISNWIFTQKHRIPDP